MSEAAPAAPAAPVSTAWHRLHPLSPVIRAGRALAGIAIVFGGTLFNTARGRGGFYTHLVGALVLVTVGVVYWLVTRWCVQDGVLRIETGLIRRQSLRFPLTQIQAIDTVRPGLARLFGLSELRLRMGGSTGGSGRLAYLASAEADALRGRLLSLARGEATEPTAADSESVLVSIPTGRLIASIALSPPAIVVVVAILALAVTAVAAPAAALGVIGSSGAVGLGLAVQIWRRFNGGYQLTVAEAADGLRVRSGLIETAAETIPRGRVQAVRMVEPLLWRPFGWCRVDVDVAGRQRQHGENRAESRQLRSVLPVGTAEDARRLLSRILPDAPADREPPPSRARFKSPLRFHNLAWGRTPTCAVSTSGRVARVTSWVPLAKVQSLRREQGPLQRSLRLATIHLDTAGRSVHASLTDRDAEESDRLLAELTLQCRAARHPAA